MAAAHKTLPIIAVLGPTASGKSSLALELAREFSGAIVNCDSRQIYRGMDIGTAKPSAQEQSQVDHHLFDLVNPDASFSAGDYKDLAAPTIIRLAQKGKLAILAGGTGFYYSAIAEGLPPTAGDPKVAAELNELLQQKGLEYLQQELLRLDPQAYSRIDLQNSRRVLRAIEIVKITDRPFAENIAQAPLPQGAFFPIVVTRPRDVLHSRIEIRVKEMFDQGLEHEVNKLAQRFGFGAPGLNSIGYAEWAGYFEGKKSKSEVFDEIVINSRQYAKRQETWFKKRPGGQMYDLEKKETREEIFSQVRKFLSSFF